MSTADHYNATDERPTHHVKNKIVSSVTKDITESEESDEVEEENELVDLECKNCGKSYGQLQHLKSHIALVHNQEKPTNSNTETFTCTICNSTFRNSGLLKGHIQQKHETRNYVCEFVTCGKAYRSPDVLNRHQTRMHKVWKLKPITVHKHECEFCSKKFKLKKTMDQHRYIAHAKVAKELNSQCQFCQTRCLGLKGLENHLQKLHPDQCKALKQKAAWFKCEVCKRRFKKMRTLKRHKANNHPSPVRINDAPSFDNELIPCETCNMNFETEVDKTHHRDDQRALTVIQCSFCLNTFNYKCQFYTHHHQYHKEKKPLLKCTLCDTCLTDYCLLRTHDLECHSINQDQSASSFFGFDNDSNRMESDECIYKNNVKQAQGEVSNPIDDLNVTIKVEPGDYQFSV